jgi:hypothetical protein
MLGTTGSAWFRVTEKTIAAKDSAIVTPATTHGVRLSRAAGPPSAGVPQRWQNRAWLESVL